MNAKWTTRDKVVHAVSKKIGFLFDVYSARKDEGACIALGVNDSRCMDDEVAERLKRMESTIAHLEHLTERLNEVVTEHGRELGQLKKKYQAQAQSLETIELERIRSTNAKPPHYG